MIITIDGVSAAGKGTLALNLADHYNLPVLGTGSLWRLLAQQLDEAGYKAGSGLDKFMIQTGLELIDKLNLTLLSDDSLKTETVGSYASIISGIEVLRDAMDQMQREWCIQPGGGIIEGRETGISIAPKADHKFFLIADLDQRAERRSDEIGMPIDDARFSLLTRDHRELTRSIAPIRPAPDALIIDTTETDSEETLAIAVHKIEGRKSWFRTLKTYGVSI